MLGGRFDGRTGAAMPITAWPAMTWCSSTTPALRQSEYALEQIYNLIDARYKPTPPSSPTN